jgi:hypothetical protein
MYVISDQILQENLYGSVTMNQNVSQYNFSAQSRADATEFLGFWAIIPFVLLVVVLVFVSLRSWQVKDR